MKSSEGDFKSNVFSLNDIYLKLKNITLVLARGLLLIFFSNVYIHNVVSTFSNNVKIDVEDDNVVSILPNVVQMLK